MRQTLPPYALTPNEFRFPALAALAGRAQRGEGREVALAVYLAARLAQDVSVLPESTTRAERAGAAKVWLSALTLPGTVKPVVARLIDGAGTGTLPDLGQDVRTLLTVAHEFLDPPALGELQRLALTLEEHGA